jgi:neuroligin
LSAKYNPFVADDEETGEELLQKLATRHYYSYTAALGVTVGVGCLLLILNMLIFAGIYYQRDRDRRRQNNVRSSRSNSSPSTETIPMSHRPSSPDSSSRQSPIISRKEKQELPPSYSIIPKSPSRTDVPSTMQDTLKKEKPPPPVRTSSNLSGGTVKKRVQIQEISV